MFLWARVEQERISFLTTPSPFQPTFNLKFLHAFPALTLPPGHKHISVAISSLPLSHFPGPGRHLELREIQRRLRLAKQPKGSERLCAKQRGWALHILPAGNAETDVNQPESYRNHQAQEAWSSRKDGRTWGGLTYRRANQVQICTDVTG